MALMKPSTWGKRTVKQPLNSFCMRSFAAAQVSRILAPWKWDNGFSNDEVRSQIASLRARSRDMYKNSPHHRRYCSLVETNVVGEGFTFKSVPHDGLPGMDNFRLDKMAAKFIEYHYWLWCSNPELCDSTKRKTVAQIDRLNAKTWARDGEYFTFIDRNAQNKYGISLRVIRPDACDERYHATMPNGNIVRCGVELDANTMEPVAYYFHTLKEYATNIGIGGPLIRINASRNGSSGIVHGFTQEDEDQTRGMPLGHAGLSTLKMLDEWNVSELAAARDEANTVGSFSAPLGREDEISKLAEDPSAIAALTAPSEPGMKQVIPQGWTYKTDTPNHPNRETTAFKNSFLRDYASAVNVEYSNLCNDWSGVNYGSVRAGTLSERDMWMVMQQMMIDQSKTPIFKAWLQSFLLLAVSGGFPVEKYEKFSEHEFRGRRWLWVDPLKDVRGAEIARAHGWKTDQQITSDFGGDFDDNVEELKRVEALTKGTTLEVKDEQVKKPSA